MIRGSYQIDEVHSRCYDVSASEQLSNDITTMLKGEAIVIRMTGLRIAQPTGSAGAYAYSSRSKQLLCTTSQS